MEKIRRVILRPYRKGMGPTFALTLWDTYRPNGRPMRTYLAYRLTRNENGRSMVLASGEDFSPSPMMTDDGDAAVRDCIGLLAHYVREEIIDCAPSAPFNVRLHEEIEAMEAEATHRFGE